MWWCINFVDFTVWIWIFIWDNLTIESHSRIHATCDPFWSWNQRSVFRENNQERENNILFVKMFALSVRPYCHLPPVKNVPYLFLSIIVDRVRLDRSKIVWTGPKIYVDSCSFFFNIILTILFWFFQGIYLEKNSLNRLTCNAFWYSRSVKYCVASDVNNTVCPY